MYREELISAGVWRQSFSVRHRQTDRQTDSDRQTETQTDRQADRLTDRKAVRNRGRDRIESKIICNGGQHCKWRWHERNIREKKVLNLGMRPTHTHTQTI